MVEISPKALRFARLVAEQQPAFRDDPQIALIEKVQASGGRRSRDHQARRYLEIEEPTAAFCVRAIGDFVAQRGRFGSIEWDANDYSFLQATVQSLREQLVASNVKVL